MAGVFEAAHPPSREPGWGFHGKGGAGGGGAGALLSGVLATAPGYDRLAVAFGQCMLVYYSLSVLLHYILPAVPGGVTRIQVQPQPHAHTLRDARRAVLPIFIKSLTLYAGEWLYYHGYGRMDDRRLVDVARDPVSVMQVLCLIFLLDLFHDAWFYWTHRLLHTKWMMRNVHYMHHQSTNPSAFTGYSFHWIEACLVFSVAIAEVFIFPVPFAVQRIYELWMIAIHLGGHCGYEIAPHVPQIAHVVGLAVTSVLGVGKGGLSSVLNNVEHHDMHHKYPKYHLSLYFTHWDFMMGTIHPEYVAKNPHILGSAAKKGGTKGGGGEGDS
uniref:Fatty acid hydroxylase domain-containing protein n=2 Tax=Hemiselmis andersenii TaxID=464988 RepID=A0A6U4SEX8_HEMAN